MMHGATAADGDKGLASTRQLPRLAGTPPDAWRGAWPDMGVVEDTIRYLGSAECSPGPNRKGGMNMNSFLVANPSRCIGCRTCEIACVLAHSAEDALVTGAIDHDFNPRLRVIKTATVSAPVQCRHCEDAPCANVCPTKAIVSRGNTIQVVPEACIGCKSCMMACPFGVMDIVPQMLGNERVVQSGLKIVDEDGGHTKDKLVALKCDLCVHRVDGPACAGVCPTDAFTPVLGKTMQSSVDQKRKARVAELSGLTLN
ncbi:MAG: 4Fe-4S dicluster domain-containing protein [Solidesulfovibrio sp.]